MCEYIITEDFLMDKYIYDERIFLQLKRNMAYLV